MSARAPATRLFVLGGALVALLGGLACLAWSAGDPEAWTQGTPRVEVVFRYDDYGSRAQESVNEGVIDAFRRHGVPFTVAVIPCPADVFAPADAECDEPLDASRSATLVRARREGIAEIALHGYSHATVAQGRRKSELRGVDPAEQERRIRAGLDEVERRTGFRPSTFVPPFDSYDTATLRAIEALGMRAISSGVSAPPPPGSELQFVPNTVYLGLLRDAVEHLRERPDPGATLVAIFHPWDMRESVEMEHLEGYDKAFDLPWLDELLGWLATQPHVRVTTIEALAAGGRFDARRFEAHRAHLYSRWWPLLPPPIEGPPSWRLRTTERYERLALEARLRVVAYAAALLAAVGGAGSFVLLAVRRRVPRASVLAPLAVVVGAAGVALLLARGGDVGWKDFSAQLVAAGIACAGLLAWRDGRSLSR